MGVGVVGVGRAVDQNRRVGGVVLVGAVHLVDVGAESAAEGIGVVEVVGEEVEDEEVVVVEQVVEQVVEEVEEVAGVVEAAAIAISIAATAGAVVTPPGAPVRAAG